MTRPVPDLSEESTLRAEGHVHIAGLDEAGRGAWAGPVYAAAVVLPLDNPDLPKLLGGVRDSKLLSPSKRDSLLPQIEDVAVAVAVGVSGPAEVDAVGIVEATRLAMERAIGQLNGQVDALLIDYIDLPNVRLPQQALPKADVHCLSVASASIVAKVERDRHMMLMDGRHLGYGFARHKGYGTRQHRQALAQLGPSPLHRMSWAPLRELTEE